MCTYCAAVYPNAQVLLKTNTYVLINSVNVNENRHIEKSLKLQDFINIKIHQYKVNQYQDMIL